MHINDDFIRSDGLFTGGHYSDVNISVRCQTVQGVLKGNKNTVNTNMSVIFFAIIPATHLYNTNFAMRSFWDVNFIHAYFYILSKEILYLNYAT